ncbi:MAG: hypothetical protein V4731_19225 [Pseudomonadota bacterium]
MRLEIKTLSTALIAGAASTAALAHEGHGLFGPHWHATDAWSLAAVATAMVLVVGAAFWLFRHDE